MLKYYKVEHVRNFEFNTKNSNVVCKHSVTGRISFSQSTKVERLNLWQHGSDNKYSVVIPFAEDIFVLWDRTWN